ncbi:unnamed protein product [Didymodactylos carnosus]|nr:unnamed protein product [Didymodactylos carnosus]CAF3761130.1 unnamed protein product [Didymodactylos carnosus]
MGMAIQTKNLLNLQFPSLLWKPLVRQSVTVEDIEDIDMQSFTTINELEKRVKQTKTMNTSVTADSEEKYTDNINFLFDSIMSELHFGIVGSNMQTYELVPNGSTIPITVANHKEYCLKYCEYRLQEFNKQVNYIRQGLYSVVSWPMLALYTPSELEEVVCGKPITDVDLLKQQTEYRCSTDHHNAPYIKRFWTVLKGKLDEDQKNYF